MDRGIFETDTFTEVIRRSADRIAARGNRVAVGVAVSAFIPAAVWAAIRPYRTGTG